MNTGLFAKTDAVSDDEQIPIGTIYLGSVEEDAIVRTHVRSIKQVDDTDEFYLHTNDPNQIERVFQGIPTKLRTVSRKNR